MRVQCDLIGHRVELDGQTFRTYTLAGTQCRFNGSTICRGTCMRNVNTATGLAILVQDAEAGE